MRAATCASPRFLPDVWGGFATTATDARDKTPVIPRESPACGRSDSAGSPGVAAAARTRKLRPLRAAPWRRCSSTHVIWQVTTTAPSPRRHLQDRRRRAGQLADAAQVLPDLEAALRASAPQPAKIVTGSVGHRMGNGELPRLRECSGPGRHRFKTYERARRMRIEDVGIRESAGQKLRRVDHDRLSADLQRYLGPVLSRQEVKGVLRASVDDIANRLEEIIQPVSKPDKREQFQQFIYDREVRAAVGRTLRAFGDHGTETARRYRIAHVLYALATYGAIQHQRSDGRSTALDVIKFIDDNYSFENKLTPSKVQRGPRQSRWEPMPIPTVPKIVVKKQRVPCNQEYPLREQPFDRNRFERSVRKVSAEDPIRTVRHL